VTVKHPMRTFCESYVATLSRDKNSSASARSRQIRKLAETYTKQREYSGLLNYIQLCLLKAKRSSAGCHRLEYERSLAGPSR
jgi:hypothetical protein